MDDGDDKFLRKKPAAEAGPEYVSPEQGQKGGDVNIPHNELTRIRTRTGHQILLHNSEDLVYISHGNGKTWIELTSNGKIDIYAEDSISIHTKNDFNFVADRDINFQAGNEINMVSKGATRITPAANFEVKAANTSIDGGQVHLNSGKAGAAKIPVRIPTKEPWAGHENLDPVSSKPDKTKAVNKAEAAKEPPMFKKYTTVTDTFDKVKGPDKK
jgi:mannose-6-phosphate isomerase-like protein (cupin superfamily)